MSSRRPRPDVADWWRQSGARELRAILNEWDPIGLTGFGRDPGDEYDAYGASIFTALFDGGRETEVWIASIEPFAIWRVGLLESAKRCLRCASSSGGEVVA